MVDLDQTPPSLSEILLMTLVQMSYVENLPDMGQLKTFIFLGITTRTDLEVSHTSNLKTYGMLRTHKTKWTDAKYAVDILMCSLRSAIENRPTQ